MSNLVTRLFLTILISCQAGSLQAYIINASVPELETYLNTINCLPKYFQCKHTLTADNPTLDCLNWAQCSHLVTLDNLLQTKAVQTILAQDPNFQNNVAMLQKKYGLRSLQHEVQSYTQADLKILLEDLIIALIQDLNVLTNAGVMIPNFNR